jgi:hypothetical protein
LDQQRELPTVSGSLLEALANKRGELHGYGRAIVIDALIQSVKFDSEAALEVHPESRADQQAFCLGIIAVERRTGGAGRAIRSRGKGVSERDACLDAKVGMNLPWRDAGDQGYEQDESG